MYAFESETDAKEFLLSIAEEEDYNRFLAIGSEDYFSSLRFHKDMGNMDIKDTSVEGYALWIADYTYDIQEVMNNVF